MRTLPDPNRRERELGEWAYGDDPQHALRHSLRLASYREELLKPFDAMLEDYATLKDQRVVEDLLRILQTARGEP